MPRAVPAPPMSLYYYNTVSPIKRTQAIYNSIPIDNISKSRLLSPQPTFFSSPFNNYHSNSGYPIQILQNSVRSHPVNYPTLIPYSPVVNHVGSPNVSTFLQHNSTLLRSKGN
jgi:hypothetical protein